MHVHLSNANQGLLPYLLFFSSTAQRLVQILHHTSWRTKVQPKSLAFPKTAKPSMRNSHRIALL